jgi:hypothetical protein
MTTYVAGPNEQQTDMRFNCPRPKGKVRGSPLAVFVFDSHAWLEGYHHHHHLYLPIKNFTNRMITLKITWRATREAHASSSKLAAHTEDLYRTGTELAIRQLSRDAPPSKLSINDQRTPPARQHRWSNCN